jgi:hypothetical protein
MVSASPNLHVTWYMHIWKKLYFMKMKKNQSHLGVAINNVQILHFFFKLHTSMLNLGLVTLRHLI